ncbi:UvrD-helicase domain-containing protein [Methylophilus sp. 14]|uniref:UvrD-helicase domain-containing protein n=1 Tax=Methylophilus sp. 14 TaxID=2781019 RepID=UPI00188E8C76|nr:ATP-dependent helicase [Methylophilus sp. 14]MBF4987054.1 ATP-dependent helicase [Methylophilus sp. 14]
MFSWTEQDLNPEQSAAILQPDSVFLVACPGSGKTKTLTYKIAYELSCLESERNYVIAITYTNRAADEIHERIESLGVDASQLWIGTIHSFCLEWIIKPYGIYLPELERGYRVIDQHERERLLERLCLPYADQRITYYDCDYYYSDAGYSLGCTDISKHPAINIILGQYFQTLTQNKEIDFELILWYALKLINQHQPISSLLSKIFPIILVDEYQDTKQIQYHILGKILRSGQGNTRLFMVGDPNQAIYGSLGGYPIPLAALRALTNITIVELALSQNYRSSDRVVQYFSNFNVYETTCDSAGDHRGYPSLITYNNTIHREDLVAEIARLIRFSINNLGIAPNEICVLAPQWIHLASMTRSLVVNMPEYSFDGPGMVPFARDIENFWYKLSKLALTEPSPLMYVKRLRWAGEVIKDLQDAGVSITMSRRSMLRECNSINVIEPDGLEYLRQFFNTLCNRLGIRLEDFAQLSESHRAFFESSQARITRLRSEGVEAISDISFFRKVFQNRNGITVSTIHGVKGAEFDVVLAYALLEGMVPHFSDANGDESAKKMLYVVGSRARKNIHLFSESGRARGRSRQYSPTEVLLACDFEYDTIVD